MNRQPAHQSDFPYPQLSEYTGPPTVQSQSPGNQSARLTPSASLYSMSTMATRKSTAENDDDTIKVVVRVRPMSTLEKTRTDGKVVQCMDDHQTVQIQKIIDGQPVKPMTFHGIFDETTSQEEFFESSGVKTMVERAVEGYNTTIFAYGQTGTGKTFTITGPDDVTFAAADTPLWGIIPRSLHYIFALISNPQPGTRYTIYASYLEIYNEQVQDLLNPTNAALPVRWNSDKGFYVENLFVVECEVLDDSFAVLEEGLRNRRTASHRLNEHSSRSHGLMTILIESETIDPDDQRSIKRKAKLTFVDLAGSEKVKESGAAGDILTETLSINKSLLCLGNCISALAEHRKKGKGAAALHVPFRDSKLTKLISHSLGGDGAALMIACVSPSGMNVNESLNTLRYAARAKRIKNKPVIQMDPREELIINLKKELKSLKSENDSLKQNVLELSLNKSTAGLNESFGASGNGGRPRAPSVTGIKLPSIVSGGKPTLGQTGPEASNAFVKIMEDNKNLQTENTELKQSHQKAAREKDELMEENERLMAKIERMTRVFGNPMAENGSVLAQQGSVSPKPSIAKDGTFSKISQNVVSPSQAAKTQQQPKLATSVDMARKRGIDRSVADFAETTTLPQAEPNGAKTNKDLLKELSLLDKEINSLQGGSKGKKQTK